LGGSQKPVWTGEENLVPTGILSPDRPALSESKYRLSYPGSHKLIYPYKIRKIDSVERRNIFFQLAGLLSRKNIEPFILLHLKTGPLYFHAHTV